MVDRCEVVYRERSKVTYEQFRKTEYRVPFLERLELGLNYDEVIWQIAELVRRLQRPGSSMLTSPPVTLVVDETGVGSAVVDHLKAMRLGCTIVPVSITAGERASETRAGWNVPKRDLISQLEVMYDTDSLLMAHDMDFADALIEELGAMEVRQSEKTGYEKVGAWREGTHDDLVLAVALAVWYSKKRNYVGLVSTPLGCEA